MPLAGLAPAAVALSVVPWFGVAGRESGRHPRVGTTAGLRAGSRSRGLDLAQAHSADLPASLYCPASRCGGLATVECRTGLAGGAIAPRQPGAAVGGGAACSFAGRALGARPVHPAR